MDTCINKNTKKYINKKFFGELKPFELTGCYIEIEPEKHKFQIDEHSHDCCEDYVNVEGDVSFMVEDTLYPISPGDAIITRPWEHHHCVYNSNRFHKHYWFLFSCNGNERLFPHFFERGLGKFNLVTPGSEDKKRLTDICGSLCDNIKNKEETESEKSINGTDKTFKTLNDIEIYADFFALQNILLKGINRFGTAAAEIPLELEFMLEKINELLPGLINVKNLANKAHISVSTAERLFLQYTGFTPSKYILSKRLNMAQQMLKSGKNVTETAIDCGFCDSSYFILMFRKKFGITPKDYKRKTNNK